MNLQVIASRGAGGAEGFYARLVNALTARGAHSLAVCPARSAVTAALDAQVTRHPLAMRALWDLGARRALRRLARTHAPCIVQTWLGRATRLTRLEGIPGCMHLARLGGYYNLAHYRHADAWVTNTRGLRDHLVARGFPAARVFHIGNFPAAARVVAANELAMLRARLALPADARCLLAAGRLHPVKGLDVLLHAFATLRQHQPCVLLLVGDGPERAALTVLARRLGVHERVRFCGWQNDLAPWYALADLVVLPSHSEALGNVILEAWAQARPVVASATAGARELIEEGVNGMIVPIANSAALAVALARALDNSTLATQLVAGGDASLRADHSATTVCDAYLELYARLLYI
jgi:glycosyltransferase involved in cell wall biosynthesis